MRRKVIIVTGLVIAGASYWYQHHYHYHDNVEDPEHHHVAASAIYTFEGLVGPTEPTVIPPAVTARWQQFSEGSDSRLAVLLTDADSNWLGVAHGFKSLGIPFIITTDYKQALKHQVVFVYPSITGSNLPPEALSALAQFPRDGGTLIADSVLGGSMGEVFGFGEAVPTTNNVEMHFNPKFSITAELTEPEDQIIRIGSTPGQTLGAYAYTNPKETPVATYEDATAAITQKSYGKGNAYALGIDLGFFILKGYNYRQEGIAQHYINEYEPSLDVLLRLIKKIYTTGQKNAVTLATVPSGKSLPVIFTHDIDFTRSLINALDYAAFEREHGITATYFMQTKYIKDWSDDVFFTAEGVQNLLKLQAMGMEIASHSVSHSTTFSKFPMGDGKEQYPSYVPFVQNSVKTWNGTILGELRVSRFLMEHFLPGLNVVSFRPGHLEYPFKLPEAMMATGYLFSSSTTADNSLTHLPFQLNYGRDVQAETPLFEFPLTIEDELDRPMLHRLPQAIALANKLKRYGGLCVILIHPNIIDQKFEFEKGFVAAMDNTVWYGSIGQFGTWWSARDKLEVDVTDNKDIQTVSLSAPVAISGLTLNVPADMTFVSATPAGLQVEQHGNQVVIGTLSGHAELVFSAISGNSP